MINPELSRRIAKVSEAMMKNGMTFEDKRELYKILNKIESFNALPDKFRRMILDAEQNIEYVNPIEQKLNYKCPRGTVDDSNKCDETGSTKSKSIDAPLQKIPGVKPSWQGIAREALKYDTFEDYEKAWFNQSFGKYWHITDDPNFKIDPTKGPRDMSSMASGRVEAGKLMITAIPDHWIETYPNRKYIAEIDISNVPRDKYWDVKRGFGHEIWVEDPSQAKVTKVWPIVNGMKAYRKYFKELPQSESELREVYEIAHGKTQKQNANDCHEVYIEPDEFKNNARGKCPKDSYEAGTFKCDPSLSDAKTDDDKQYKHLATDGKDPSKSIYTTKLSKIGFVTSSNIERDIKHASYVNDELTVNNLPGITFVVDPIETESRGHANGCFKENEMRNGVVIQLSSKVFEKEYVEECKAQWEKNKEDLHGLRWTFSSEAKTDEERIKFTLDHEIGHYQLYQYSLNTNIFIADKKKAFIERADGYYVWQDLYNYMIGIDEDGFDTGEFMDGVPGGYSMTSSAEMFAETYVAWKNGLTDGVDPDLLSEVEKVVKFNREFKHEKN